MINISNKLADMVREYGYTKTRTAIQSLYDSDLISDIIARGLMRRLSIMRTRQISELRIYKLA